jgi:hypothetical protein
MILLIGTDQDPTMCYFKQFLMDKNIKHVFLNQILLLNRKIKLLSNYLLINDDKYLYQDFSGALNRMSFINYGNISNQIIKDSLQYDSFLGYLIYYELKNVLNVNLYSISNDSKLFQLDLISGVIKYIKIPDYVVIKNHFIKDCLHINSNYKRHVVKSLSSIRSIVKEFESNTDVFNLSKSTEPVLFQQFIDGINIRVHVIDEYIYPIVIFSDSIDYRYENNINKFEETKIPNIIEKDCVAISKHLGLRFAGVDLLLTKDNEYFVLEVNPSPGYSYFEEQVNSKFISEKLVEVLSNE